MNRSFNRGELRGTNTKGASVFQEQYVVNRYFFPLTNWRKLQLFMIKVICDEDTEDGVILQVELKNIANRLTSWEIP